MRDAVELGGADVNSQNSFIAVLRRIVVATAVVAAVATSNIAYPQAGITGPRCGSYCLYAAMKLFDRAPNEFGEVEKLLGVPAADGYSLEQIRKAAELQGLNTLAVTTTIENLSERARPFACIAHLDGNHFSLIAEAAESGVLIVDPPTSYITPVETFQARWKGVCLLISDSVIESEEVVSARIRRRAMSTRLGWIAVSVFLFGFALWSARRLLKKHSLAVLNSAFLLVATIGCGPKEVQPESPRTVNHKAADSQLIDRIAPGPLLLAERDTIDLGQILLRSRVERHEVKVSFQNRGAETLEIRGITLSCGCLSAKPEQVMVAPNSWSFVQVGVRVDKAGIHESSLTIHSNCARNPSTTARIRWHAVYPIETEPAFVDFGEILSGVTTTRDVRVTQPVNGACAQSRLSLRHPLSCTQLSATLVDDTVLSLELLPGAEPGSFAEVVVLSAAECWLEEVRIPVKWTVIAPVTLSPPSIFVGTVAPASQLTRTVVLAVRREDEVLSGGISAVSADCEVSAEWKRLNSRTLVGTLKLTAPADEGAFNYRIRFVADDTKQMLPGVSFSGYAKAVP